MSNRDIELMLNLNTVMWSKHCDAVRMLIGRCSMLTDFLSTVAKGLVWQGLYGIMNCFVGTFIHTSSSNLHYREKSLTGKAGAEVWCVAVCRRCLQHAAL